MMKPVLKYFLAGCGMLFLSLGMVGIFVPLLPTTPFLLLAAACFFRSSDRLYCWLTGHRILGNYIRGFRRFHAVSLKAKAVSIATLWTVIGCSAVFTAETRSLQLILLLIAVGVSVYLLCLRTLTQEMIQKLKETEDR